jgi:DNA-binding IclR family transcriptional regulator
MATKSRRNSSGLARDIEILDALAHPKAAADGLGVVKLAAMLDRDKATVSRALATLAEAGLVERDPVTLSYRIGCRIFMLAALAAEAALVASARPLLRRLARHSRETTHLNVMRGGVVCTLISELSPNEVRGISWEGHRTDALRTPSGRVLMSDWSDAEITDWYIEHAGDEWRGILDGRSGSAEPRILSPEPAWLESVSGQRTVHDLSSLLAASAAIRERGFDTSDEEFEAGVVAASAPVRDHTGKVVAAINVSAPKGRVGGHLDRLGIYVARAAEQLSVRLGAKPDR